MTTTQRTFLRARAAGWAPLCCGLLLTACNRRPEAVTPPPPEVAVVTVAPQAVELTTELPGRTSPYLIAEIRPQVVNCDEQHIPPRLAGAHRK